MERILVIVFLSYVLLLFLLKVVGLIKSNITIIFIAIITHVIGLSLLITNEICYRKKIYGMESKKTNIFKDKVYDTSENIYLDNDLEQDYIPLEEALVVNDTKTKRKILLDILKKDPDNYVDILNKAKASSDTEIVHYATSTMMGLQVEYDKKLRKYKEIFNDDPKNEENINSYVEVLDKYIKEGFLQGKALNNRRVELDKILNIDTNIDNKNMLFLNIDNKIELKKYSSAEALLQLAKNKWKYEENIYFLYGKLYKNMGEGYKIRDLLEEIKDNNLHLSKKGQEWFEFWGGINKSRA